MIPYYAKGKPKQVKPSETWANEQELKQRSKHKVGRLKREIKKHSLNCFKRQHALLKLQQLYAYQQHGQGIEI